jgi:fatty-acyl-CoA synthase
MALRTIPRTPSAFSYPLLIKNLLPSAVAYSPNQEIVYRDSFRYTYADFNTRVSRLANALTRLGVEPGSTVAVMDVDSHRYLECYFAVPMMGAVLHKVHIRLTPEQILYTINHAKDDVIIVNSLLLPLLEAIYDKIETAKTFILIDEEKTSPASKIPFAGEYDALVNAGGDHYDFPDFDENTMATTFYTSGTTGNPKGVYFSHRQLVLHTYGLMTATAAYKSQAIMNSGDVYMPLTPMFHVHAWGVPYLMTMLGAKQIYPGRYEPEMILKLIIKEKVTFSHCVPTIIHMLLNSPVIDKIDLSGWKVIIGGSALPKGLCRAALKHGINIYSAYGMSETCPLLTAALLKPEMLDWSDEDQVAIRCRTGFPIPNVRLEIVDHSGKPLPHDGESSGEIVVRAPWLTQGYLNDPEKSEDLWRDGWLHTGDVGFIDPDGYLQITDRLKDVIKTGGEWISSLTLEDILSQHEAVSEGAVIGVPDDKWGERPLALAVIKEPFKGKVTEADLIDHFKAFADKGAIPRYGIPERVALVDSIAKTGVGKIDKKVLRKDFAQ